MLPKCTRLSVQALKIPGVKKLGGRVPQRGKGRSDTHCVCCLAFRVPLAWWCTCSDQGVGRALSAFSVTGLIFVFRLNIVIAIVCSVLTIESFNSNPGRYCYANA